MRCRSRLKGAGTRCVRMLLLATIAGILVACGTGAPGANINEIDRAFLVSIVSWDMNRDGSVTCDEWKAYARAALTEADANRDGKLTAAEFDRLIKSDRLFHYANFAYFDSNRDGFVDAKELVDRPNPAFGYLDSNKDCILSSEEIGRTRALTQAPPEVVSTGKDDKIPGSK